MFPFILMQQIHSNAKGKKNPLCIKYQKHIEVRKNMSKKNLLRGFESLSIHGEAGYFPLLRISLTVLYFIIVVGTVRSAFIRERHLSQGAHFFFFFVLNVPIRGDGTRRRGYANVVLSLLCEVTRSLMHHAQTIQSTINPF